MIKFFCRGCGKELWEGAFEKLVKGERWGETIDNLWNQLFCCDCTLKKIKERK